MSLADLAVRDLLTAFAVRRPTPAGGSACALRLSAQALESADLIESRVRRPLAADVRIAAEVEAISSSAGRAR